VVMVRRGWVVIEAGRPLHVGDRFTLLSQRRVRGVDPATRRDALVPEGDQTGILVLERVRGAQGAGRLVRNAYAEIGDLAVPTSAPFRESLVYGRRFPGTWRVYGDLWLGPMLDQNTGLGLMALSAVEYRFRAPIKLALELAPLSLIAGLRDRVFISGGGSREVDMGAPFSGALRGVVGLALSGFELSAGLGGAVNTSLLQPFDLQMSFSVRAGSLDGLHMAATFQFFLPVGRRTTDFDGGNGAFNIPVHRRLTLLLAAGGTPTWLYSTIGFRVYVAGTGGPGTWILSTGAGGGYMISKRTCPPPSTDTLDCQSGEATGGGPLFHLGLDRRF
jgi:hypothetical protein